MEYSGCDYIPTLPNNANSRVSMCRILYTTITIWLDVICRGNIHLTAPSIVGLMTYGLDYLQVLFLDNSLPHIENEAAYGAQVLRNVVEYLRSGGNTIKPAIRSTNGGMLVLEVLCDDFY